jgi:hypothetical protein
MGPKTYKDYEHSYMCPRDRTEIHNVFYSPAICPVCHKPVEERHPEYYRLRKEYIESLPNPEGYVDYTKFSQDIIFNIQLDKYKNGNFIRTCQFNRTKIIGVANVQSGYIVQHINRKTVDSKEQYKDNAIYNHDYWEAWPVENGHIIMDGYDEKDGVDDTWSTFASDWWICTDKYKNMVMKDILEERKNSNGTITMTGTLYWAPADSELANIVRNTFHDRVPMAVGLPAAWVVEGYERFKPVDNEIKYEHSWDLTDEEKYQEALEEIETEFSIKP